MTYKLYIELQNITYLFMLLPLLRGTNFYQIYIYKSTLFTYYNLHSQFHKCAQQKLT